MGAGSLRSDGAVEIAVAALVEVVVVVGFVPVLEVGEEAVVSAAEGSGTPGLELRACDILCLFWTELPDFVKKVPLAIGGVQKE